MVFDVVKAIVDNDWNVKTVEDKTKSTYATIHDFNPREDVMIIPLASEGNYNISLGGNGGYGEALTLNYNNGGGQLAAVYFDETISDSATAFYRESLLSTALIIDNGSVVYGGTTTTHSDGSTTTSSVFDNLYKDFDNGTITPAVIERVFYSRKSF